MVHLSHETNLRLQDRTRSIDDHSSSRCNHHSLSLVLSHYVQYEQGSVSVLSDLPPRQALARSLTVMHMIMEIKVRYIDVKWFRVQSTPSNGPIGSRAESLECPLPTSADSRSQLPAPASASRNPD